MELKGDLKRNGLPTLFRNFANEHFQGVLTITSPVGEKLITLSENQVTVYCDELNESSRLGNILIGRGLVTEEVLEDVLRDQRRLDPRPKLGDMLTQRGIVSEKCISDARRFQIEEDICDILSWKNARFSFEGADTAREIHPEDFAYDQVHRMSIDPDSFFKYVAKVTDDWDAIGDRLPTQYLCFKLSPKATEGAAQLSKDNQRILRFLKEGRSVEGTVKQSCLGRIQVCVHVIELLEKGLVLPASGSDLRFMASEHRAQKRYHDALYIYRRLLESPDAREERTYLENLIAEISATIVRLKQIGEYGEEAAIVSHKGAKEKYVKSVRIRKIFLGVFVAAALAVAAFLLIQRYKPKEDLIGPYRDAIRRADQFASAGEFNEAAKVLDDFLEPIADKENHFAVGIREKLLHLDVQRHNYLETKFSEIVTSAQNGGESKSHSVEEAEGIVDKYAIDPIIPKIKEWLEKNKSRVADNSQMKPDGGRPALPNVPVEELSNALNKIDDLIQQKKYGEARLVGADITKKAPANSDIWKQAEEKLKSIKGIEQKIEELVGQAVAVWTDKKGDMAIKLIGEVIPQFGDLEGLANAEALKARWSSAKSTAELVFKSAKDLEDKGTFFEARTKYLQVSLNYSEFPKAMEAQERADALKVKCDDLIAKIKSAQEAKDKGDFHGARSIYRPLLELNPSLLVDLKVEIPVNVTSVPPGSILEFNGQVVGTTPKTILIMAGEPFGITVKRPGFTSKSVRSGRVTSHELDISLRLELDPVVIDFPSPTLQPPFPLLAPAAVFDNRVLILNGPDLIALDPPNRDPVWTVPNVYDSHAALPENVPIEEKNFWNCRVAPICYKPGFLLLPLRSRELLEIDLRAPASPQRRNLFGRLAIQPPEVTGTMYIEEHSKLAGKSMLVAAFADGMVRCFLDFDKDNKNAEPRWTLPLDPPDAPRREPAAGLYGYRGLIWALSSNGLLQAFDPIEDHAVFKQQLPTMSPRSTFSSVPGDPLAAFVQRNGQVTLFDLGRRGEVWSLPPRRAMEESVGVMIDESGVFVTARKDDYGELTKFPRTANPAGGTVKPIANISIEGYVNLDMAGGKNLYLITHFNKIFAYSKTDLSPLWEFKIKPEMGEPKSIRAFGEYVYVLTDKGKVIVLKSE